MAVCWMNDDETLHFTNLVVAGAMIHLVVESMSTGGWDWHVWDQAGLLGSRYGQSATADDAKAQAEMALMTYRAPRQGSEPRRERREPANVTREAVRRHREGLQQQG